MRLQELDGRSADAAITLPQARIQSAKLCSGSKTIFRDLPVQNNQIHVTLKPFEVVTVRAMIGD